MKVYGKEFVLGGIRQETYAKRSLSRPAYSLLWVFLIKPLEPMATPTVVQDSASGLQ